MPLREHQAKPKSRPTAKPIADAAFAPQLCKSAATPPAGDDWLHETKWDGYRLLASVSRGKARLWSRNAIEWSAKVPELVAAIESLQLRSAQLDGEMIVLRNGLSDFNALQGRLSVEGRSPAIYVLFDLPYADGRSLRSLPLIERKTILAKMLRAHPHRLLRFSRHTIGDGDAAYAAAVAARREGIISKRIDSPYVGARNGDWIKIKARPSDEFIVVGFTEPKGSRAGIGALLLALPVDGKLKYVGRVGTGLSGARLLALRAQLEGDLIDAAPADIALMARKDRALATWVKPRLVVEVFHQGIGGRGLLRQPAFKAIRADKTPADLGAGKKARHVAHAAARKPAASRTAKAEPDGIVRLTHPDRVVFAQPRKTKGDIADYYRMVARWILPEIAGRPLSILRCPAGVQKACFFQKHLAGNLGRHVHGVMIRDTSGRQEYLRIDDEAGLIDLVQMNVIEFHPWGARAADPERADRVIFDLDPHAGIAWPRIAAAARAVRTQLESIGLESFLRTSGGKGLHLVVPLRPAQTWTVVRKFARSIAESMVRLQPKEFVASPGESKREDRIFIDWLRNGRGATSVASYSLRARPDGGIAMPLAWSQLGKLEAANEFTIANAARYLARRRKDPWDRIDAVVQSLPKRGRSG
jgi:bifunctional non-homologous end joining protein LigD